MKNRELSVHPFRSLIDFDGLLASFPSCVTTLLCVILWWWCLLLMSIVLSIVFLSVVWMSGTCTWVCSWFGGCFRICRWREITYIYLYNKGQTASCLIPSVSSEVGVANLVGSWSTTLSLSIYGSMERDGSSEGDRILILQALHNFPLESVLYKYNYICMIYKL